MMQRVIRVAATRLAASRPALRLGATPTTTTQPLAFASCRPLHCSPVAFDEITVNLPPLAESITEGEVGEIEIEVGDWVARDDAVMQVETDKTTVPVNAPESGTVTQYFVEEGDVIGLNAPLFVIDTAGESPEGGSAPAPAAAPAAAAPAPAAAPTPAPAPAPAAAAPALAAAAAPAAAAEAPLPEGVTRVKMSRMRLATANHLKNSQNTAAFLTTFNEIDMTNIKALRAQYKDEFEKRHGVKLGFMGAFAKAVAHAVKDQPTVNAFIDGKDIVYHDHVNISVAVSAPKGLVTPVVRGVEKMSIADVELSIRDLAVKARDGTMAMEDMDGGTFTISNGGVFGSLMGTPILNTPQSGILGMHGTFDRPVAINGEVVIRPMMYVALTYDHRLIDGREAVTFLRKVKEGIEDPTWMILG